MFETNFVKKNTLFCSNFFFKNLTVYEIMWKNTVQPHVHCIILIKVRGLKAKSESII
jgi:hypothetical protein